MAVADFTRINSNIGALNSLNSLNTVNRNLGMYQLRLATGRRINSSEDDPAGLTIATKFRRRNEGLKVAIDNIGQAKNMFSVAEGALSKIQDILVDMRNKVEAAANDTLGTDERAAINQQLSDFTSEIDDIVKQTSWNGNLLLNGLKGTTTSSLHGNSAATGFNGTVTLQTGAETNDTTSLSSTSFGTVAVCVASVAGGSATSSLSSLYVATGTNVVSTASAASTYMGNIDTAMTAISERLQTLGSLTARLSFKEETLSVAQVNTEASFNRIMNADMAMSQLEATKYQILQQTATAMLAQSNQAPQSLLSLFR
jgi:flagellin